MHRIGLVGLVTALWSAPTMAQDLLVADFNDGGIRRYDATDGAYLGHFVQPGAGGLFNPTAMAFADDGLFYVGLGSDTNHSVLRFDAETGEPIDVFLNNHPDLVGAVTDIAFHGDEVYVTEWNNAPRRGGVSVFDRQGSFLRRLIDGANRFNSLTFDEMGRLFATDFDGGAVRQLDPMAGGVLATLDSATLTGPMQLRAGADGLLYVVNWGSADVLRFDAASGAFVDTFIDNDATEPNAQSLALAPDGSVLVDNHFGNTIHRFDGQTGALLGTLISDPGVTFLHRFVFMPPCPADLDGDGDADSDDFFGYLDLFVAGDDRADLDDDGDRDADDFFLYLDAFAAGC